MIEADILPGDICTIHLVCSCAYMARFSGFECEVAECCGIQPKWGKCCSMAPAGESVFRVNIDGLMFWLSRSELRKRPAAECALAVRPPQCPLPSFEVENHPRRVAMA